MFIPRLLDSLYPGRLVFVRECWLLVPRGLVYARGCCTANPADPHASPPSFWRFGSMGLGTFWGVLFLPLRELCDAQGLFV